MLRTLVLAALLALPLASHADDAPRELPPDTLHWQLEGQAKPTTYLGRPCLFLNGGAGLAKDLVVRDGVIDADVATTATVRGFLGLQFRLSDDLENAECIYLRPHHSGAADAIQYTPVLRSGLNWQLYNGPGFNAAVDIPRGEWFHLRLELQGATAKLYVKDMTQPALVVPDLKSGVQKGRVALWVLTGDTYFANVTVRATPDVPWQRHEPPMPAEALTHWNISPAYDALARNLERPLTAAESDTMPWQSVEAEPPGIVPLYRYREAPHVHVSFERDFSKRLEPQPGMRLVYARTRIDSDRDQVRKLEIGYSDDVSVFLNGRILYRGRSAQNFRDPAFLGIVNPENDAVYLPLQQGPNELLLAVSELGGGWGFICRLSDVPQSMARK